MKHLKALGVLLLTVLIFSSVEEVVPGAEAGRCRAVLNPTSCKLSVCRRQCLQLYNGNGVCQPDVTGDEYRCACFYNC